MTQLYKFLSDTGNDSMLVKGFIGMLGWVTAQGDTLVSLEIWDRWYGVMAQVGAGCVGLMMFLVLASNAYKNLIEARNLRRKGSREQRDWERIDEDRERAHDAAQVVLDNTEPIETDNPDETKQQ